ncbi:MAG: AmmeMemoRadiSam system radical SAM enzyme [Senegalia sp. (in: firmicutes)]|uniref:AmmeMemoRadiSam system radical SAM enzyme n=1 Tax=Senegalia sp. (in: firmicutes) TaxID=1924098 RepID=UPI003F9B2C8E
MKKEALFYEKLDERRVHCYLCPHNCVIEEGNIGRCKVRINENGKLLTTNYREIAAMSVDRIEKKPLKFFKSGSNILSVGTFGCNLTCDFCQNYSIAQITADQAHSQIISEAELVDSVLNTRNNIGLAFTYNEPSIWYEYMYETAKLLKEKNSNKSIVVVTNGFINKEPLEKLLPYVDAMNIDLKGFSNEYYSNICGGRLNPVLETIKLAAKKVHIEITTLLVTGENDNLDEIEELAKFLSDIDKTIPLHLAKYFPMYKMDNKATSIDFMYRAKDMAEKYLDRVVLGNV